MAKDKDLKDYLHRLLVPPGFRPDTPEEIEQTLDGLSKDTMPNDMVSRILAKAKGEIPMEFENRQPEITPLESSTESEELLALHRGEGDKDSDEVNEKLEQYRRLADGEDLDEVNGDETDAQ